MARQAGEAVAGTCPDLHVQSLPEISGSCGERKAFAGQPLADSPTNG